MERNFDTGAVSVALPTATHLKDDANERASTNMQANIVARAAEITHESITTNIRAKDIGEVTIVVEFCIKFAQNARNIVTSLNDNAREDIHERVSERDEPTNVVAKERIACRKAEKTNATDVETTAESVDTSAIQKVEKHAKAVKVIVINDDDESVDVNGNEETVT